MVLPSTPETYRPTTLSGGLALLLAITAVLLSSTTLLSVVGGALGLVSLGWGLYRGSRRAALSGSTLILTGAVIAGVLGASAGILLLTVAMAVLVWDLSEQAISVGEQLGPKATTTRGELVHASASLLVASVGGGIAYVFYSVSSGGQPLTALVVLLLATVLLTTALRESLDSHSG